MDNNKTLVPAAIIIAGLLIAGAVFYNGDGSSAQDQGKSVLEVLGETAEQLDIDLEEFNACLDDDRHVQGIRDDMAAAQEAGGTGTPYSIIVTSDGQTIPINGAQPYENLEPVIDALIAGETLGEEQIPVPEVTADDNIRGDINAPVVIVEYSDIDCPYCSNFHGTMKQVIDKYGEAGQVAWVYRHLPLVNLHPNAPLKAEATECVAELGGNDVFWTYLDALFGV